MSSKRGALLLATAGYVLNAVGEHLNKLVEIANSGRMPVIAKECVNNADKIADGLHVCATSASHLLMLADFIRIGNVIYCVGDFGIFIGAALLGIFTPIAIYKIIKDW
jgi:hypothetical protein